MRAIIIAVLFLLAGCSGKECTKQTEQNEQTPKAAQTIQQNRSLIKAEIIELLAGQSQEFALKVRCLETSDDANLPGIAVAGEEYLLSPMFRIDENGTLTDAEANKALLQLRNSKKGDIVRLSVTFTLNKGWFIYDYLRGE